MGFRVDHQERSQNTLDVYLSEIVKTTEGASRTMLQEAGNKVKERVIANLNRHRRTLGQRYRNRPAMADDIKMSIRTSPIGEKYIRITGGKRTGTLWHIVNDGTLHSQPTHFMDEALKSLDDNIDVIWDKVINNDTTSI